MDPNPLPFTPEQELLRQHDNRSQSLRAIFIALIPLATVAFLLRFIARKIARTKLWWDDWLCFAALLVCIGLNVVLILTVDRGGLGMHAEFAGPDKLFYGLRMLYIAELLYQASMTFIKLSILLFYYRLFNVSARFNTAIWVVATITLCWYFASSFVIVFQCRPVAFLWDHTIPGGQCVPQDSLWIGSSVTSLLTDVTVLCLPMPLIWRMRATRNQRIALSAVFLLGAFVCITSVIRLSNISGVKPTDPSWSFVPAAIWTPVECSVAVVSACLPTLKPLLRLLFDLTDNLPFDAAPRRRKDSEQEHDSEEGATAPYGSDSPDRTKQWRAHANAMRICELGEIQMHDGQRSQFDDYDEKSFGRNFSRPWTTVGGHVAGVGRALGVSGKTSKETMSTAHKSSRDTIVAQPSRETVLSNGVRMLRPTPEEVDWRRAGIVNSNHHATEIEIREDSPHLWGRDGRRNWRLPNFDFEKRQGRVISMPSPSRLVP